MRSTSLRACVAVALLAPALWPATAAAHLRLVSPPSRYGGDVLKEPPCGMTGGTRSDNVTVFEPGETIEVVWEEYIDHPAHYRIAFDVDGDDDFVDPSTMTEEYSNDTVLLDGIEDRDVSPGDNEYRVMVTLPDVECDNCTLQVIQVMYDKPPYTIPGNDIYYQCADLILRRAGGDAGTGTPDAGPTPTDGGTPPADAGGTATGARDSDGCCTVAPGAHRDPAGALLFGAATVTIVAARRRRRR